MKKTRVLFFVLVAWTQMQSGFAAEIQTKMQGLFGDTPVVINDYDEQLKKVEVDGSKVYFATHDGRYLFAGPIYDTEQKADIVSLQENQHRQAYLHSLPQDVFVSYPSSSPSKHQITVFTDIDCPYCRKFHGYMGKLNQHGVSVNYVMVPRSGVGSTSYNKTISALCSDSPADAITKAMQSVDPIPNICESKVLSQHKAIAQYLKIHSTPTIIMPNGQLKLGMLTPDKLFALLAKAE